MMITEVRFYGHKQHYFEFSNFHRSPIILEDKEWPTSEHFFQAKKFIDMDLQEYIRSQKSPMKAAQEGRKRVLPLREDWEMIKEVFMWRAIYAKFTQHQKLRGILVNTGDMYIIEASPKDSYWGWGHDKMGRNRLGILLMELRFELE